MQNSRKQRTFGNSSNFIKKGNVQEQIHQDKPGGQNAKKGGRVPVVSVDEKNTSNKQRRPAFGDLTNATLNVINETEGKKTLKKPTVKVVKKGLIAPKTYTATVKTGVKRNRIGVHKKEADEDEMVDIMSSQGSENSDSCSLPSSQEVCSEEELMETDDDRISVPPGVDDVDSENLKDPIQVALYAYEIFEYYKQREKKFTIQPYLRSQPQLSYNMRSILVDWLVEVQENFELNHETLYLAVKLVDLYLSKVVLSKEHLQLVGATSLFIACKFDERCPPLIEDFLYICDDAYNRKQFIEMEKKILRTIDFDLGIPLSYRFLRRYAKCARATMETLTLARYILELSLMEYSLVHEADSKLAAAVLYLAFRMKQSGQWNVTMEYYTGYKVPDFLTLVRQLNTMVSKAPTKQLGTIRSKYSHEVFYEVAKIPAVAAEVDL